MVHSSTSAGQKKLRVLHILTRLIAAGADENTIHTVKGIDSSRFESHLLVGRDSEIVDEVRAQGVKVIVCPHLVRNVNPFRDLLALVHICRFVRREAYDIVHTHTAKAGFIGRLAARLANAPLIVHTLHGLSFHDFMPGLLKRFYIALEKFAGRYTDLFISVGENIKNKSIAEGIGNPEHYVTIYSGMDLSRFENVNIDESAYRKALDLSEDDILIGTVARLEPRKGPHYFIETFSKVKKICPRAKAVIVGTGSFEPQLQKLVSELDLQGEVVFTGFRTDIAEMMSIFDVVCLTSLWEGIPRVLIQGAKLGKPLVAFDIDGNSEIITDQVNGYLVPPMDIDFCAERLVQIVQQEALRKKMSAASLHVIDERWDKAVMVRQIEAQYRQLAAKLIAK